MLHTMIDDVAGDVLVQAGDIAQKRHAGRIQVDAHMIHARLDDIGERVLEMAHMHVVLVESHTHMLRIDFHKLSEGIL